MAEFTIRSDHVDVEEIMRQIRLRIKEKRGVDYTEEEIRELANVKLERFLDPDNVRSDLVEQYRRRRPPRWTETPPENYGFEDSTIYESHRPLLRWIRRLLKPVLKLLFNPNPIITVLHRQGRMNEYVLRVHDFLFARFRTQDEIDDLNFEVLNNLVVELTRLGIEVKNLKMRLEALSARLDFDERRARAFEGVVQYRPGAEAALAGEAGEGGAGERGEGEAARARRRRRRRGRRRPEIVATAPGGEPAPAAETAGAETAGGPPAAAPESARSGPDGDDPDSPDQP
jgi:hypothetical protein